MNKPDKIKILKNEPLYDGFIKLSKITANVPTKDGSVQTLVREVHDHGNVVTVLPVDKARKTAILISQWRLPAYINGHEDRLWEAPAGIVDPGETPEKTARREALEETGYEVSNTRLVADTFSSPGLLTERVHVFLADYTEADKKTSKLGVESEGEDIILKEFTFDELFEMMTRLKINDSQTLIALYALKSELDAE